MDQLKYRNVKTSPESGNGIRIVKIIYQTYHPSQGRYPRVSGQARILVQNGFHVTVLGCDRQGGYRPKEVLESVNVERIPVHTGEMRGPVRQFFPLVVFWIKCLQWLSRHPFDILHCHNIDVLPLAWLARRIFRRPVVFESHEPEYYAFWPQKWQLALRGLNFLEYLLSKSVDCISVTNQYQVNKYRALKAPMVALIGNYPLPSLRINSLPSEKLTRSGLTFGRFGTIYPDTGFEVSVKAFAQVAKNYQDTRFLIGGRVVDNYKDEFFRLIEPHRDHIQYLGPYSATQMPVLYNCIDVSLLTYPKNRFFRNITPRKYFDSLANGVPVIMTDIGGLGAVVEKAQCGIIVDENDISTITAAMYRVLENPGSKIEMANNALRLAQTEYDYRKMAGKYARIQQDLVG